MFTSHGHQIPGTIAEPRPKGMGIARCGGPRICNVCALDTVQAIISINAPLDEPIDPVEIVRYEIQTQMADSNHDFPWATITSTLDESSARKEFDALGYNNPRFEYAERHYNYRIVKITSTTEVI